jgi:hypothetical protein
MMVPAPGRLHHGVLERISAGFCVIQVLFEAIARWTVVEVNDAFDAIPA